MRRDLAITTRREILCSVAGLLLILSAAARELPPVNGTVGSAVVPLAPAPAIHDIDWRSSPLDLGLRGLNGERFRFHCPAGKPLPGQVTGSGSYTDGSSICAAAVHAGVIRMASGGLVTIEVRPGRAHFAGSLRHYILSEDYAPFWDGSFLIISPRNSA